jgi:hypothetical protein
MAGDGVQVVVKGSALGRLQWVLGIDPDLDLPIVFPEQCTEARAGKEVAVIGL